MRSQTYIRLVLALGEHDKNYVDAYYGPDEYRGNDWSLDEIRAKAVALREDLATDLSEPRWRFMDRQVDGLLTRIDMLSGKQVSFDDESKTLYDIVYTRKDFSFYEDVIRSLEAVLPGGGSQLDRFESLRSKIEIPTERMQAVFDRALQLAREQSRKHIELPETETFELEFVKDQVWGGYNWYKGNSHSLIQVNTDFPSTIDRVIDLMCHEGYPGHHVYNSLLEKKLVNELGYVEFTVYPLFSAQSLIAEGTAEYGIELSFSPEEHLALTCNELAPLANLNTADVEAYMKVRDVIAPLGSLASDVASRYLDGEMSRSEAVDCFATYGLVSPERADQRVRFIDANRSYVLTYGMGKELVRNYVQSHDDRWAAFTKILCEPTLPSDLIR